MPGRRKATAKRFGIKSSRRKGASAKDLAAARGRAPKGGAVSATELKRVAAAHGCPACPHPAGFIPGA
jgi:hypothetical protein